MFWKTTIDSNGKAVLITGCDSGFGNGLALKLNSIGFKVFACVLDPSNSGSQLLTEKCKFKDNMIVLEMDVTSDEQIDRCFNIVQADLARDYCVLWAVVNNAGIASLGKIEWGTIEEHQKVFDVNVFGVLRVTRKFIPLLRLSKGRIVITASLGGRVAIKNLGVYCMTKSAVISLSDSLRIEMNPFKINVCTIEPGLFKTSLYYAFPESISKNWSQTDETVRQIYGEKYFQNLLKQSECFEKMIRSYGSADLDIVINDMTAAVIAKHPKRRYIPIEGLVFKLLARLTPVLPQYFIDRYILLTERFVPEFCEN